MLTAFLVPAVAIAATVTAVAVTWYGMAIMIRAIAIGARKSRRDAA